MSPRRLSISIAEAPISVIVWLICLLYVIGLPIICPSQSWLAGNSPTGLALQDVVTDVRSEPLLV